MFYGHTPFDPCGMIVEFEYVCGRKREVQPEDCLGLVLVWTRTRGLLNVLQLVFGLTYTNLSVYLRFGIHLIVETFRNNPLTRVSIPPVDEIESFQEAIGARHPLLNNCWATMDGLKLYLQSAGHADIQEKCYNGWTHDHYVTSVFCFCPDGTIPIAFFNVPGSVHDSQVAEFGNIYDKLERVFLSTGAKCTVDSAFGNMNRKYLYKLCQDHLGSSEPTLELNHVHDLPLCASILTCNRHLLTAKLVFPISLLSFNFRLTLPLFRLSSILSHLVTAKLVFPISLLSFNFRLTLPLFRLNLTLIHHHTHHILKREAVVLIIVIS